MSPPLTEKPLNPGTQRFFRVFLLSTIGCISRSSVCNGLCPVPLGTPMMMKRRVAARPTCVGGNISHRFEVVLVASFACVPCTDCRARQQPYIPCQHQPGVLMRATANKNLAESMLDAVPIEDDHSTDNKLRHDAGLPAPLHLHCRLSH